MSERGGSRKEDGRWKKESDCLRSETDLGEGDLDGRERQRRRGWLRDVEAGDRETRMRNIRLGRGDKGRTKKKVCKASATERDGDHAARFQSERVRETAPSKGGMGDARGKDPPTQESRPLFGFKQGKGCKTRRGLGDPRGARTGSLGMANAYGRSPARGTRM